MELDDLNDLYRDSILDHRRNPHNIQKLEKPDIDSSAVNPFCGDEIHLQIMLGDDGRVAEVGLQGEGCSINQAAGSMLTEVLKGKSLDEIEEVSDIFRALMKGEAQSEAVRGKLGNLAALEGVRQFPVRIKCALLTFSALEDGIEDYRRELAR